MADTHPPETTTTARNATLESKRQRRPSVRLDNMVSDETLIRRTIKNDSKPSKPRPLTDSTDFNQDPDGQNANFETPIANWKVKDSKKRVRSNRASKIDNGGNDDNGYRDFDREDLGIEGEIGNGFSGSEGGNDGVRIWLSGLGLERYAMIFGIHEVDNEVLPFLTLEDLRDMGINAVGSRRKMFCAIQKLSKGFS